VNNNIKTDEFNALIKITVEMSRYLYPYIREILKSKEDLENNSVIWNDFNNRFIDLIKERFNLDSIRVKKLLNQTKNDEIIINEKVSDLIYINENRFIVVEKNEFYKPSQISLNDSADIIKSLLLELETNNKIQKISENTLVDLNSNTTTEDESFENFSGNIDNTNINPELVKMFFEADVSLGYQQQILGSDRVIFRINEIDFNSDIKADNLDDFLNFASNTRSETEFYQFFLNLRNNSEIIVNE